jgi:hypothetical protein
MEETAGASSGRMIRKETSSPPPLSGATGDDDTRFRSSAGKPLELTGGFVLSLETTFARRTNGS